MVTTTSVAFGKEAVCSVWNMGMFVQGCNILVVFVLGSNL